MDLKIKEIQTKPAVSRFEWQHSKDCKSDDPRDCEVLCQVERPAEYITLPIVEDTSQTTLFEFREYTILHLFDAGGVAVWEEVDCHLTNYNLLPISFDSWQYELDYNDEKIIEEGLLALMKDKPNLRIEISSHTDARNDKEANLLLSEKRAKAVEEFLISKGIQQGRLTAIGYGGTRLKNKCSDGVECSEAEHAENVRIEFRVLSN